MCRHSARKQPHACFLALLAGLALVVLALRPAAAQTGSHAYRPGEVLIEWAPGTSPSEMDRIRRGLGATRIGAFARIGATHERIRGLTVEQAVARYGRDPNVRSIEPNYLVRAYATPDDAFFGQLWGLANTGQNGGTPGADIHATQAWSVFTGSRGVLVAIIDTGMDYTHPDLAANAWVNPGEIPGNGLDDDGDGLVDDVHGWDFANDDADPMDDNGHGTHCAGTIGAIGNNAIGVVGVNWNVTLMPIKFLAADGVGSVAGAVSSIEYATRIGARVMSNSWGGAPYSQALRDAIAAAADAGILFVAAAGNDGADNDVDPVYPAGYDLPNIISVAASDPRDHLASFSNYGATSVDLAAPGTDILSTVPGGGYQLKSGTSMATPHVAGAAALVLGLHPGLDGEGVKTLLLAGVDPVPALAGLTRTGGRLNALAPLGGPDSLPPAAIADLAVSRMDGAWAELQWTAPGDDGTAGRAARYDVRYSLAPITVASFDSAARALAVPAPQPAGALEQVRVSGLGRFSTLYYFAVRTSDELGNLSPISNVASGTTLAPPRVQVAPDSLSADLPSGEQATRTLTVSNSGASELAFALASEPLVVPGASAPATVLAPPGTSAARAAANATATWSAGARAPRGMLVPAESATGGAVATGGLRVLLLYTGGDVTELQGLLAAFPDIARVDAFDGGAATPTDDDLRAYDCVIVAVASALGDRAALGDALADYIDGGGGVVFTLASFIAGYELGGRLRAGGYFPFDIGTGPAGASTLGEFDASHPIMQGVSGAGGEILGVVPVAAGAVRVASWANGIPFVATRGRNVAAVNAYFGVPGFWSGDLPLLVHNAAFWASGVGRYLSWSPATGVVPPGGSADVQITFDATGRVGGDYVAYAVVRSNDPVTPSAHVPTHMHVTGAPDLALSATSLEFGTIFVGASQSATVTVRNRGTDRLTVGQVVVAPADFSTTATGFGLAPGASLPIPVTFAPQSVAGLSGTLELHSDDPDSPVVVVALHGTGKLAPALTVAPDSLSAQLSYGESATRTLTIANPGGAALEVTLSAVPAPASAPGAARIGPARGVPSIDADPAGAPQPPLAVPANAGAAAPGVAVLAGSYSGTYLNFGISDYGEIMPFQYPPGIEHLFVSSPLSGYTVAYRTGGVDHLVFAGYQARAGLGAVAYRELVNTSTLLVAQCVVRTLDGELRITRTFTFDKRDKGVGIRTAVENLTGAPVTDLVFKEWADWDVDGDFPDDSWNYDRARNLVYGWDVRYVGLAAGTVPAAMDVNGMDDVGRRPTTVQFPSGPVTRFDGIPLMHFDLGDLPGFDSLTVGTALGAGDDLADLQGVMDRAVMSTFWLGVVPRSLLVPPHASQTVDVTFDATRLLGGDHEAQVVVRSNDPRRPEVRVPAHLHVTGAPHLAVSDSSLAFGAVFVGGTQAETLQVSNAGTGLLTVAGVSAAPAEFAAPAGGFTLAPGAVRRLIVTFSPPGASEFAGTLEIRSDDPDEPVRGVALRGSGLPAPAFAVSPDSLSAELFSGDLATRPLIVANAGGSPLSWSLSIGIAPPPVAGARARPPGAAAAGTAVAGTRRDGAGLSAPCGPSGIGALLRRQLAALGPAHTLFFDDMEFGDNGWTRQVYGPDDLWHRTTRTFSSPTTSWWCGVDSRGDYFTGSAVSTAVVSPPIDLRLVTAPITLQFFELYLTEPDYDFCMVDVSADDGDTWTPLRGGPGAAPSGNSGSWQLSLLDLSAWAGRTIRVRFYFDTRDAEANTYPGWFFDDVLVTDTRPAWFALTPASGTVAVGGSQPLQAQFDASGLPGGDYLARIAFATNDPLVARVTVPTRLHVTSAPNLEASADALDFGAVFAGGTRGGHARGVEHRQRLAHRERDRPHARGLPRRCRGIRAGRRRDAIAVGDLRPDRGGCREWIAQPARRRSRPAHAHRRADRNRSRGAARGGVPRERPDADGPGRDRDHAADADQHRRQPAVVEHRADRRRRGERVGPRDRGARPGAGRRGRRTRRARRCGGSRRLGGAAAAGCPRQWRARSNRTAARRARECRAADARGSARATGCARRARDVPHPRPLRVRRGRHRLLDPRRWTAHVRRRQLHRHRPRRPDPVLGWRARPVGRVRRCVLHAEVPGTVRPRGRPGRRQPLHDHRRSRR